MKNVFFSASALALMTMLSSHAALANSECFTFSSSECSSGQAAAAASTTSVARSGTLTITRSVNNAVARALSNSFKAGPKSSAAQSTGKSSGDATSTMRAWSSLDYTDLEIKPDGQSFQRRSSDIYTGVVGLDTQLSDKLLLGATVSYGRANTNGHSVNGNKLDLTSDTFSVTPYVGYAITDRLLISALAGYSYGTVDIDNYSTGVNASGDYTTKTVYGAATLSYDVPVTDSFGVRPFVGYNVMKTWVGNYTDSLNNDVASSDISHWQATAGATAYTAISSASDAYLSVAYERDQQLRGIGENSVRLSLGASTEVTSALSAGLEATTNLGRETQHEYGASANMKLAF